MKKLLMGTLLAMLIALVGCSASEEKATESQATTDQPATEQQQATETTASEATYEEVDIAKAKELIEQGATIVDVRTADEFAEGHIPGAIVIPLEEIESRLAEFNPDEQYLMVCRSGNRSGQASEILVKNGIKNAYNMLGGMKAWDGEVVTE